MKMNKLNTVLLIAALATIFILLAANLAGSMKREIQSDNSISNIRNSIAAAGNHAPINISGNGALATFIRDEGLSGEGTYVSPYIIENFIISASTANGIEIQSTDAYLIIQDCTIEGNYSYRGIYLYNAANVNISNNLLSNNSYGVYLDSSSNNTLSGITANNNSYGGICLDSSSNNTLSGNTANNNGGGFFLPVFGIALTGSSNNTLSGNTANNNGFFGISLGSSNNNTLSGNTANNNGGYGISLSSSSNNTLSGNIVNNNSYGGIFLLFSSNNTLSGNMMYGAGVWLSLSYDNNIDTSNKVNDKSVRYYEDTLGVHLSGESDVGQVILVNSDDSIIEGLNISETSVGISVLDSFNCSISENTVNDSYTGIFLGSSSNNTLSGNTLNNISFGISLDSSSNNTFSGNMMYGTGVWLSLSYDNNIDTSNKVNDKSVRYYEDTLGVHLSGESDVGQVILVNSDDSIIEGLNISETSVGISVLDSFNCSISENTVNDNSYGVYLSSSSNNTLSGNTVNNNSYGGIFLFFSSNNNTIYFNNIYGNINANIYGNATAFENFDCTDNQWDNGTTGNYWGVDYINNYPSATNDGTIWSIPYEIYGTGSGIDHFPLVHGITPPTVDINSPSATTYTTDTITISLTGDANHYWYYIAGQDDSNQSWTTNVVRTLADGTYTLHAYGNDSVGNEAHVLVTFIVDISTPTTTTTTKPSTTIEPLTTPSWTFPELFLIIIALLSFRRLKRRFE